MGHSEMVPREYAEFRLACLTGWNIDEVPAERVDQALQFMSLESRHAKIRQEMKQ